ncbi:prepilin-type N-terminal cleavage/methylation domain-containing protein [Solibacillus sp. FSL W7-1464]|uniref:type II secretion system protein n=1 Tax=Solibacillus sp. FSL W7-1464 TaxID=2921706 RepID=UPI0030F4DA5D
MFSTLKKRIKNEKGLSLVELLAVIVILGIVAAIAVPAIGNIIDSSRVKAAKADAANILSAAQIYFTENSGVETFSNATDGYTDYLSDLGTVTTFTVTKVAASGNDAAKTTVETTGTSGGKDYSITASTLSELEIDNGKAEAPFSWTTTSTTPTTPGADD